MIGVLAAAKAGVEKVWGWRRVDIGESPNPEYTSKMTLRTGVDWSQAGASLRWQDDGDEIRYQLCVGPLDLYLVVVRENPIPESGEQMACAVKVLAVGNHQVTIFQLRRHLGVLFQWSHLGHRLSLGPVGVDVERAAAGR